MSHLDGYDPHCLPTLRFLAEQPEITNIYQSNVYRSNPLSQFATNSWLDYCRLYGLIEPGYARWKLSGLGRLVLEHAATEQLAAESPPTRKTEGSGQDADNTKPKRRGGKPLLEVRNPLLFQVYNRIQQEHRSGEDYRDAIDRLKSDKQFVEQIEEAGQKPNTALVKNALDFFAQRHRRSPSDNRQTPSD